MPGVASPGIMAMEVAKHQLLRERVLANCPDADEETLADTLEGLTNLKEMIAAVIRSALMDRALADGLKTRLEDMKARYQRLETRAEKKRELALAAMTEAGLKQIVEPDFTASTRPSPPALVVTAPDEIPEEFWVPQPPRLDRQSLIASLKHGHTIPGTMLSNPNLVLSVRNK